MPEYSAMSAMIRSRMPQKTKFAYTRSPEAVVHQPVPANARSALKTPNPATMNIMTAAKVTIPGLRVTAPPERAMGSLAPPAIGSLCCAIVYPFFSVWGLRFVDRLFHFFRVCPYLLLHLLLGEPGRLLHRPLDCRLSHHYQGGLAIIKHLSDLLEVRVGHPAPEVADEGARPSPNQAADQDRRRKDHANRCPGRQTRPATMLGRLLGLVDDLDFAFFVLGEDGGVIGAYDMLAMELLQLLEICLGVVDALVFACVHEHRIVAHRAPLLYAAYAAFRFSSCLLIRH